MGVTCLGRNVAFAGLCVALVGSCATSSEPYSVKVMNDRPDVVTLAVCASHDCRKTTDAWTLKPGRSGSVNVEVRGGYNSAILFHANHSVLGCLPLRLSSRPSKGVTVRASVAVPCGGSGGVDAVGGKDWPDPNE